jgi:hypothetical protein
MAILLSGCGLPPAVVIASYVADGASYVATGKSVSDHGISEATGRDCAMWRIVKLESPCSKEPARREEPAPVVVGDQATAPPHRYLVLGSFESRANAERFAAEFPDAKVAVVESAVDRRTIYRVVAGPLSDDEVSGLRTRLATENRTPAWEVAAAPPTP